MEINLQESVDWFKLTNEIKGKHHTLKKGLCINFICDDSLVPGLFASLTSGKKQTTHLFRHPFLNKKLHKNSLLC